MTPSESETSQDAARYLRRLIEPCKGVGSTHDWMRCTRCLSIDELSSHQSTLARRLIEHAIAVLERGR